MWQRIKSWARALKNDGMTLWFCCRHPQMPWLPKIFALLVVGYFLSPIDLIPDFIPVLGYLDELILLPGCIYLILRMVPPAVLTEARAQATQWIATHQPKPRSIVAAIVIMLLWMIFFGWLWQRYGAQLQAYFSAS
jgi:uncharacterized membrane protein YkvA (DUF1232 family)